MPGSAWNWWWLLDRPLVDRVLAVSQALAGPAARDALIGAPCLLDDQPLRAKTVDPAGVRFALAALRRQATPGSDVEAVTLLAERAVLESAAVYDLLGTPATEWAAASVETIASRLVPVAPVFAELTRIMEARLVAWLRDHGPSLRWEPDGSDLPPAGRWFAARIDQASIVLQHLRYIRGADTFSDYHDDQERIADSLARFVAGPSWAE